MPYSILTSKLGSGGRFSWKLPPYYEWTDWDTCNSITAMFGKETDYSLEMQVRDTNNLIATIKKEITIYHENLPPKPVLEIGCKRGNIRTQFYFDSWMTRDLESLPTSLQVRWDYNGDGNFDTEYSRERTVYHQYPEAGIYQVVLEVKDPEGLSDTTSQYVIVSPYTNETGLIRDHRDEQMYGTVKIGNQWWMSENLNFAPWDSNKDYVEKFCYRHNPGYCEALGGLYSIYHATRNDFYNDVEGICPTGWHIPSRAEWEQMINYIDGWNSASKLILGGETDFNTIFAGYGKETPGYKDSYSLGQITYFWSFKRLRGWPIAQSCWNIALIKDKEKIYPGYSGYDMLLSVRCVKDDE
ncbi:MAG: FISUMP domain-containing protein [Bacteroidota bacterium]|nr:FISUMP domain-containing protein [Bacteroidota bacterium]